MLRLFLYSFLASFILSQRCIAHSTPAGVLAVPIRRAVRNARSSRKSGSVVLSSIGEGREYGISVAVGRPPQNFTLAIDTGSPNTWVMTASACKTNPHYEKNLGLLISDCGGRYDSSASSTYRLFQANDFSVLYGDSDSVTGDTVKESLHIGNLTVSRVQIGVATRTEESIGILGLSGGNSHSPTVLDSLFAQGQTKTRAFCINLDDLDGVSGTVLFGGLDLEKFIGNLTLLPFLHTRMRYPEYLVTMSSIEITDVSDSRRSVTISPLDMAVPALLDTGTSTSYIPADIFRIIANFLVHFGIPLRAYVS